VQQLNPHNIRDMTKKMEQVKMRLKTSMPRDITLPISSTSNDQSVVGGSVQVVQIHRRRGEGNTVDQAFNKEVRDELDCTIVMMFYAGGLSFNLTKNP